MKRLFTAQFLRFVGANSVAALVNILTRLTMSQVILDTFAIAIGFLAGLSTSYLLCRGFVFRVRQRATIKEAIRFTGINLFALAMTVSVYNASLQYLMTIQNTTTPSQGLRTAAHALGVAAPILFSFIAQKSLTFHQKA